MKKILSLLVFVAICCFISACSDEDLLISESEVNSQDLLSTKYDASLIKSCELDSITPLERDSVMMQKLQVKTRSTSSLISLTLF